MTERTKKVMSATEAIERYVRPGCDVLAVGGAQYHNCPMALLREMVRQRAKMTRLVTAPSSITADLLIGAGLVGEILSPYVGFDHFGLAPNYRRAAEQGTLRVLECDEALIVHGLYAAAGGLPFVPYPHGPENTDVPKVNPEFYRTVTDPFSGEEHLAVPPIHPDVAIIHCQEADLYGNAVFRGAAFADQQMAMAADVVIVQVEQIVPTEKMHWTIGQTTVPGFLVSAVVEIPFGCHPTSSHRYYNADEVHLREYIQAAKDPATFQEYLDKYVLGVTSESQYLARAAGREVTGQEGSVDGQ